ncbi:D-arabinono-1,4-lactone oxidase-domain-containing protein [Mycena floridula]|nr:D-arabinono-1,4-lactone oxidase-domain-containing protein [Mycena floridula]
MAPHLDSISLDQLYSLLEPITVPSDSTRARFSNWGQTFHCQPLKMFEPESEYQCELILELARREGKTVRAAGVGHSPSDLACTKEFMMRTERLNRVIEINPEKRYVVTQGGITLRDLHTELERHGFGMINVGSISDQTLAGIVTTATHGTGIRFGVISTHVTFLTLLLADGSRVTCSRHEKPDLFIATICGLGSTGIILQVGLEVEPFFRLKEVQESQPFEEVMRNLDNLVHSAEHTRMWWFPAADMVRLSFANRTSEPRKPVGSWLWHSLMGFHAVQLMLFLGRFLPTINTWTTRFACWLVSTPTIGVDNSYNIFNVECRYPQFTTEWAIPYSNTEACLRTIRTWLEKERADPTGLRPHFPVEIRFSDADDIWLSPSNGQRTCWIGIVQYKPYGFNVPYRRLFKTFESILERHGGKPHWAKAHELRQDTLRTLYPRFDDFVGVLEEVDPHGLFRNEYIQRHIFGSSLDGRVFKRRA